MKQDDKKIEAVIDKLMSADRLDKPSFDFTDKVMSKVEALSHSEITVYKPLIPKYVWWLIVSGFAALITYVLFKQPTSSTISLSERYDLPDVSLSLFEGLSFNFSSILMYAMVLFAIMVNIQIPLLKQYYNNRLSY
ncbi:hypothetical protein [Winogradskyella luteola]|uniref:Uncharacterized protein n=1 Tax=Winogradskyella luteola TaxID=2828330 RepID=A0A9X1FCV8_9FLAO|nr:hypothetical protein [Winogradskyella luteola]MBV7270545.1 hypothetical protein [Winogradskyella luteola]